MAIHVVEQMDGTTGSNYAAENVEPHEVVTDNVGTGVELVDGDEAFEDVRVALGPKHAPWIHENDEDTSALEYDGSSGTITENDRVVYAYPEDSMVVYLKTLADSGNGESAPSIDEGDIVGVPDTTVADGESAWAGRVAQEGYTNTTTFNRSNSNFVAIGEAAPMGEGQLAADSFDDIVRVRVSAGL